jgi:thymidylate kinase
MQARRGIVVAFIGVDGSGKSTLTRAMAGWLSPAVSTMVLYLGSGKGPASAPRRALRLLASLARTIGLARAADADAPAAHRLAGQHGTVNAASSMRSVGDALWVLSLARERRRRVRRAREARNAGMVVLCDRYPQSQLPEFNEGALHDRWRHHRSWLLRLAARKEYDAIRYAEADPPDLIVRLQVQPELASLRHPEMPPELLRERVQMVNALRFQPPTRVVDIDAGQPLEQVLLQVKQAIREVM